MSFGGQTVTFVTFTLGAADTLGVKPEIPAEIAVKGCRFRPLSASETAQAEVDVATQVWKCTAPPVPAALTADSTGYLKVDDVTYNIIGGAQPFTDMAGVPFKVTVLAQKQSA